MSISFEAFDRMSPDTLNERVISEAYKKANDRIENDRIEIDPTKFTDYSPESVSADLAYVERREKEITETQTPESAEAARLAMIMEEILVDQIELNEWLGEDTLTRKASRYDDLANGVDEIIEMKEASSSAYMAVAVDITYSSSKVRKKLKEIKKHIDSGELTTIKYFENSDETVRGRLLKVPHAIIGIDRKTVLEISKMWIERDNKSLAKHPVQLLVLDELLGQLNAFRDYAEEMHKADLVKIYDRQINLIQKVRSSENKMALRKKADLSYRTEDKVFLELRKELNVFRGM